MKKAISVLAVFMLVVMMGLTVAPTAKAALGDTLLKVGSYGPDVSDLQTKLNYVGYPVGKVDGIFGNLTRHGVVSFQAANNLAVDGIVGPLTANALNNAYAAKQRQDKVNAILATAKQYVGVRYQWGGSTPQTGFDCSGFTSYVFAQNHITLPRISRDQYTVGSPVAWTNLQPADLVFFSLAKNGIVDHVGIYLGNGQFINASSSKGVTIYSMGSFWQSVFIGGRRVL